MTYKKILELSKIIIKKENKYLIIKRTHLSKHYPNKWDFPGGKIDPGETPTQASIREAKEETNFEISPSKEIFFIEYFDETHHLGFSHCLLRDDDILQYVKQTFYPFPDR